MNNLFLLIASFSITIGTTVEMAANFSDNSSIPWYNLQNSRGWINVNLNDFIVPSHKLNISLDPTTEFPQADNPSNADINLNVTKNESGSIILDSLADKLDHRYERFLEAYNLGPHLFATEIDPSKTFPTNDYTIINAKNGNDWYVGDLASNLIEAGLGHWASYNLIFKNLLNNTSFNFSLNLCYFDTYRDFTLNSTNLPHMNATHSIGWNGLGHISTNLYSLNFYHMTDANGDEFATFRNINQVRFFLQPFVYQFSMRTYDTCNGWQPSREDDTKLTEIINLNTMETTVPTVSPISYVSNQYEMVDQNCLTDATGDCRGNELWGGGVSSIGSYSYSFATFSDVALHNNSDGTISLWIMNDSQGFDAGDTRAYTLNTISSSTSLTGSFNTDVFNNTAYSVAPDFNPAQILINKLTNLQIAYPDVLGPDINNPSAQQSLFQQLNKNNNNIFGKGLMPVLNYKFTLQSGSSYLVHGTNATNFTITFSNHPAWTATINVNIAWNGSPTPTDIAQELAQAASQIVFPVYFVDATHNWQNVPVQNAISNGYLFNGGYGQVAAQGIWNVCPIFKTLAPNFANFQVENNLKFGASGQDFLKVTLIYENCQKYPIIIPTVFWKDRSMMVI